MLSKALNEKCLRECNVLFSKLVDKTVRIPTEEEFIKGKEELLKRLSGEGDLHNDYVNRVIMGYEYAISNKNKLTGNLLIDDLNNGIKYEI